MADQLEKNNWKTSQREPVKNQDLWRRLDAACQGHKVNWHWVKGHAGHPENERCDELARIAATHNATEVDTGFQASS